MFNTLLSRKVAKCRDQREDGRIKEKKTEPYRANWLHRAGAYPGFHSMKWIKESINENGLSMSKEGKLAQFVLMYLPNSPNFLK